MHTVKISFGSDYYYSFLTDALKKKFCLIFMKSVSENTVSAILIENAFWVLQKHWGYNEIELENIRKVKMSGNFWSWFLIIGN